MFVIRDIPAPPALSPCSPPERSTSEPVRSRAEAAGAGVGPHDRSGTPARPERKGEGAEVTASIARPVRGGTRSSSAPEDRGSGTRSARRSSTCGNRRRSRSLQHRETAEFQYQLSAGEGPGWAANQVFVIDDDQGNSGSDSESRPGFQRLLAEVGVDHVGMVLGLEMSRLARSCKDWHHLLEICGLFRTLLADRGRPLRPGRLQRPAPAGAEELHEIRHGKLHFALRSPRR